MGEEFEDLLGDMESQPEDETKIGKLKSKISDLQRDSLRELGNIAVGVASNILSEKVNKEVNIGLPYMDLVSASELVMFVGGEGKEVMVSAAPTSKNLIGHVVIVFSEKSGITLYDMLNGNDIGTTSELNDEVRESVSEICTQLSKSYLDAINDFLEMEIECGQAKIFFVDGKSFLEKLGAFDDRIALVLETDFSISNTKVEGDFIMLTDEQSTEKLLDAVNAKLG